MRPTAAAIQATLLAAGVASWAAADPIRVLMIGNSYTQGNSTARATLLDLQGLFDADPTYEATIVNESFGGATLYSHASPDSDAVAELINSAGLYDVVVLQERSDRPGRAMKFGGTELSRLNDGAPRIIDDYLRVLQPQAEVVLFNTWARHPDLEPTDDDDLAVYFNDDPAEMQDRTTQGYEHVLTGSPKGDLSHIATIAPVGPAWQSWYETHGYQDPSALLHDTDGSHQNALGSYLSAAVLFESITGKSSVGNAYAGAVTGSLDSQPLTLLLQQQAAAAIAGDPIAGDFNNDGAVSAADYTVWRDSLNQAGVGLAADGNRDGSVDMADYELWKTNYGMTVPSLSDNVAVPEPTAAVMLVFAIAVAATKRSTRTCEVASAVRR